VFLGQIVRNPLNPEESEFKYAVNSDDRPYIGLRGEQIVAPSGNAIVQVGAENDEDYHRFAVFSKETRQTAAPNDKVNAGDRDDRPRLSVGRDGRTLVRGDLKVYGKLDLAGAAEFRPQETDSETELIPWQIYHSFGEPADSPDPENEAASTGENGNGNDDHLPSRLPPGPTNELRVVLPRDGEGRNQFVIGFWSPENQFVRCLTVDDRPKVTVHGDLHVEGKLAAPRQAQSPVTAQVQQLLAAVFQTGLTGTTLAASIQTLQSLLDTQDGRRIASEILTANADGQTALARAMLDVAQGEFAALIRRLVGLNDDDGRLVVESGLNRLMAHTEEADLGRIAVANSVAAMGNASDPSHRSPMARVIAQDSNRVAGFVALLFEDVEVAEQDQTLTAQLVRRFIERKVTIGDPTEEVETWPLVNLTLEALVLEDQPDSGQQVTRGGVFHILDLPQVTNGDLSEQDEGREAVADAIKELYAKLEAPDAPNAQPGNSREFERLRDHVIASDAERTEAFAALVGSGAGRRQFAKGIDTPQERLDFFNGLKTPQDGGSRERFEQFVVYPINQAAFRQHINVAKFEASGLERFIEALSDDNIGRESIAGALARLDLANEPFGTDADFDNTDKFVGQIKAAVIARRAGQGEIDNPNDPGDDPDNPNKLTPQQARELLEERLNLIKQALEAGLTAPLP
jgi:hypothetical protein